MFKLNRVPAGALTPIALVLAQIVQTQSAPTGVKSVVFVHGAFANGSSWSKAIPLLESKGLNVMAVQNPLTSLADDVAAAKRAIALLDGPLLLVGHSWSGVVISEAGNDPNVAGLVYIAAFTPGDAQSLTDVSQDVDRPASERNLIWATQGAWSASAPTEKTGKASWKIKPAWCIVASKDRMINPDLQRVFAKKMSAVTLTLDANHVPMLSQPAKVAVFIAEADKKSKPAVRWQLF